MTVPPIRPRDRDSIMQSLRAGVTPRVGQHLIQVGRKREIETLVSDIDRIADGQSSFRAVIGDYGAGKTFFLNLIRSIAMEKKLVVMSADLNPDRRLHASGGQARSLYTELARNMSTRTRPEGGALPGVVEKFISTAKAEAEAAGVSTDSVIAKKLEALTELVSGYDFAKVIRAYCKGADENDESLRASAIQWLRGEITTRVDARAALGVRGIVDDSNVYDQLKLMALFVRLAGYGGLLVVLDEMVNLYKLANTASRNANYEQILRILNDCLQGSAASLGFLLGGTPEFLLDTRRGMYSYRALESRLAVNTFTSDSVVDFSGPVIRLSSLTPEDLFVLLQKIRSVHALGDPTKIVMPDDGIRAFMKHCSGLLGADYFRTPRTMIVSYINLLAVLEQNPDTSWEGLVGAVKVAPDLHGAAERNAGAEDDQDEDNVAADFRL